ncbi:MAG: 50S ribosomal protein L25 [Polyangiales bacterium]
MDFLTLHATPRAGTGKSPANRIRREGKIPAVAYGKSLSSTPITVDPAALLKVLQGPKGLNTVMKLAVDGGNVGDLLVMVREVTHHPVTRQFLHADFIQVKLDEDVDVEVPFILTGKSIGITEGGVLNQVYRKLPLRTRPNNIPLKIEAEITNLALGDALKVQDLKLPEGVRVRFPQEHTVAAIVAPEKDRSAEEAAAAAGAAGAAAPAAGAAAKPGAAPAAGAAAKPGAAAPAAAAKAAPAKKK